MPLGDFHLRASIAVSDIEQAVGEGLERGPEPVFATLLHEAAHALADAREIQDTSRQGRYHNLRFRALAEELGLVVTPAPGIGWSATTLPAATAALYRRGDRRARAGAHRLSPRRADRRRAPAVEQQPAAGHVRLPAANSAFR
jgi:hypothetical protein